MNPNTQTSPLNRLLKWLFPILLLTEIVLVWSRALDAGTAIIVGVGFEVLTYLVGARQIVLAYLRYRQNRAAGFDAQAALEEGLSVIVPRKVARIISLEPRIWVCLYCWVRHRPQTGAEFSYSKRSIWGFFLAFILITAPFEILAYELLLPWAWVRLILLLATLYTVVWLLGFYASLRVLPYRLASDGLQLHYGIIADAHIPYSEIAKIWLRSERASEREGLQVKADTAYISVGGRTDVTIRLHHPIMVQGLLRPSSPVTYLHLAADQPIEFAAALAERAGLKANDQPPAPAVAGLARAM